MPFRVSLTKLCTEQLHLLFCDAQLKAVAALRNAPALTKAQLRKLPFIAKPATSDAFRSRQRFGKNHALLPAEKQNVHAAQAAVDGSDEAEEIWVRHRPIWHQNQVIRPLLRSCAAKRRVLWKVWCMALAVIRHFPSHIYCLLRTSSTTKRQLLNCLTTPAFSACITPLQEEEALTDLEDDCVVGRGDLTPLETVGGKKCACLPVGLLARLVRDHDCDQGDSGTVHAVMH